MSEPVPSTKVDEPTEPKKAGAILGLVTGRITGLAGLERTSGFSFGAFFREVFGRHTSEDVEEYLMGGTVSTTPPIELVDTSWPKPWIFFRALLAVIVVYLLFDVAWRAFENITIIPGLIITGSFAIPLATLIFFVEINVRRNVSLYQVAKMVVVGGVLSIIISLILLGVTDAFTLDWLGSSIYGLVEEPGKTLALLIVAALPRYKYILNGLLFGAAIGAGFAAFESAGYALFAGVVKSDPDLMTTTILLRGILSPFGHIVWTAMCGAALWKVKGDDLFRFRMLTDFRFLRILFIAIVLHMAWNAPLYIPFFGRYLLVGAIGWVIIFGFVSEGLAQLRREKEAKVG